MPVELTISIKTEEDGTYKKKYLLYDDPFTFSPDDPKIKECIEQTLSEIKGTPEDIKVRAAMQV